MLLMVFLVLRNLLRLIFEQRKIVLGKSLRPANRGWLGVRVAAERHVIGEDPDGLQLLL